MANPGRRPHRRRHASRLATPGDTLVVVEHDPKVMQAADATRYRPRPPASKADEIGYWAIAGIAKAKESLTRRLSASPQAVEYSEVWAGGTARLAHTGGWHKRAGQRAGAGAGRRAGVKCDRREPPSVFTASRARTTTSNPKHNEISTSTCRSKRLVASPASAARAKSTLCRHTVLRRCCAPGQNPPKISGLQKRALEGADLNRRCRHGDQRRIGRTTRRKSRAMWRGSSHSRSVRRLTAGSEPASPTAGTFSFKRRQRPLSGCGGNGFEPSRCNLSDVYRAVPDWTAADTRECRGAVVARPCAAEEHSDVLDYGGPKHCVLRCRHGSLPADWRQLADVGSTVPAPGYNPCRRCRAA